MCCRHQPENHQNSCLILQTTRRIQTPNFQFAWRFHFLSTTTNNAITAFQRCRLAHSLGLYISLDKSRGLSEKYNYTVFPPRFKLGMIYIFQTCTARRTFLLRILVFVRVTHHVNLAPDHDQLQSS